MKKAIATEAYSMLEALLAQSLGLGLGTHHEKGLCDRGVLLQALLVPSLDQVAGELGKRVRLSLLSGFGV